MYMGVTTIYISYVIIMSYCNIINYFVVTAKIRNLKDYHYRLLNNISPLPSGIDVANTLKYFSQTLLR